MNYEEMSDFDVNSMVLTATAGGAVCNLRRHRLHKMKTFSGYVLFDVVCEDDTLDGEVDYCNNPSDAWPIIVENKISISHQIARYSADSLVYDKKFENGFNIFIHNCPMGDTSSRAALRAAMIVFLKMQESK